MSKWWSQNSCPGLGDFKACGFNPSATSFSLLWPRRPLCSPGRRAFASRPEVPQTFQHIRPLFPPTSVYHFPSPELARPCLLPCRHSDVREDGSQCLVSEHLSWQSKDSMVHTCFCFVSLQHGICQSQNSWMPPKPPRLLALACQTAPHRYPQLWGRREEEAPPTIHLSLLAPLPDTTACTAPFCYKPPPGWNPSFPFEQEQEQL